jgi:hypothetical protein
MAHKKKKKRNTGSEKGKMNLEDKLEDKNKNERKLK